MAGQYCGPGSKKAGGKKMTKKSGGRPMFGKR